ncbi:hypothetical protein BJY24_007208 [Nocardia transvalensis]|uniref:Uncharacterized protein n=1 Tax=Nocardia transvalensis TaxID=37333 RepID=A0A7W9PLC8_9NOCA|nr:hypothetical protein [Nocardia transvalensis]MBB5918296.1 hypothetical protein [Nocardia transvalensis]
MHRIAKRVITARPLSLVDIVSEHGTSAVLDRISELRSAGMVHAARAVENELATLSPPVLQERSA